VTNSLQSNGKPRTSPLFDAHLHVIDPRFPLTPNQGYLPQPFTVADYLAIARPLGVLGGALVAGSFQGFDQDYLRDALARLGPGFVGVAQIPLDTPVAELRRLDALGVRALRFNLRRGMHSDLGAMQALARRAHAEVGWHCELYLDAAAVPDLGPWLAGLPSLCIDHLGLTRAGLPHLPRLLEAGVWVKATGFARLDFPPAEALAVVCRASPGRVVFGTDLPGTRAPRPFDPEDLSLIAATLADAELREAVLYRNALTLYRLPLPNSETQPSP
jgi:predicted TIM-barrel fold metal-dependent hydrolase